MARGSPARAASTARSCSQLRPVGPAAQRMASPPPRRIPVGEPLLVSDVVVVAARKNTQRFEQVDWLLGLDRRDGHVRWSTSVAGAPGTRSGRRQSGLATDGAVVIDATGSNKSMSHALNYCAFGGRLVYVGITQQEISFLQAPALHRRELTIMGSRNAHSRDFARIIALIEDGSIDTGPWITHRANVDEMIAAFPSWLKPENGVIKAMVALT